MPRRPHAATFSGARSSDERPSRAAIAWTATSRAISAEWLRGRLQPWPDGARGSCRPPEPRTRRSSGRSRSLDVGADLTQGVPLVTSVFWAAANCLEPLLGALALGYVTRRRGDPATNIRVGLLCIAAVLLAGAPLASLVGSVAAHETLGQPLWPTLPHWYGGDVVGILVVALVVLPPGLRRARPSLHLPELLAAVEISVLVFGGLVPVAHEAHSLVFLPLMVLALRADFFELALAAFAVAAVANVASALGDGPFARTEPNERLDLQLFTLAALATVWLLAVLRRQVAAAQSSLDHLRSSYWHVARDEEVLPICMSCARVEGGDGAWVELPTFLRDRTDVLSHGDCPTCADALRATFAPRPPL